MPFFVVATRKADGTGGPIKTLEADDYEDAGTTVLGLADVQAAGGTEIDYIKEINPDETTEYDQASETTLAAISVDVDDLNAAFPVQAVLAHGTANPTLTKIQTFPTRFNGTTWDLQTANQNLTLLASAARTNAGAPHASADQTNHNARGVHVVIDVTAIVSTPSITLTIEGKDEISGKYYTMLTSAAITGTGTTVLKVYPGITASANVAVSDILPRTWRIKVAHSNGDSITYSVGASLIL